MFPPGTKLIRKHNPELGIGVVVDTDGRFIDVFFPDAMERMRLTVDPGAIVPIQLEVGDAVLVPEDPDHRVTTIIALDGKTATLATGHQAPLDELWPVLAKRSPLARLAGGERDQHEHLVNRADGMQLVNLRHQGSLANLLGGRIELFAHQLDTAKRALESDPVRWLIADEVGLGKTIIAHMITSAMLRSGRIERVTIIAPETLTIQWLGELYRKFHQIFVRVDEERIDDVALEIGPDANPFDIYPLSVTSLELLHRSDEALLSLIESPPQLIVFDEAHRLLETERGMALLEFARGIPHALMLTATPFQMGVEGFLDLADVLDLDAIAQPNGRNIVKGVSAVTRADIPELPKRLPEAVQIDAFDPKAAYTAEDPRVAWIIETLKGLKLAKQKALIFVDSDHTATKLKETLERVMHTEFYGFTDDLKPEERDIELSRFRLSPSPALVSSGAGSEGRNFQFCDVLINLDVPDDPTVLAQRIGRLDRIGRERDIPIYYFLGEELGDVHHRTRAYEEVGVFADASVGSSPAMAILRAYFMDPTEFGASLDEIIAATKDRLVLHDAAWMFPNSHDPDDRDEVLDQLPDDLELLIERFCVDAGERIGMEIVEKDGLSVYYFEHGATVVVDTIPGVPRDARHLGTFDRREAIDDLDLEFFAIGHPMVEGLIMELEDSDSGRTGSASLSRRRIASEFGLEALMGDAYLLLFVKEPSGAYTPRVFELSEGELEERSAEESHGMFLALEHSSSVAKALHKAALEDWSPAIQASSLDTPDIAMAVLVQWDR